MKKIFLTLSLLLILSCTNTKQVYWCGDHACINNKEKEAYFKKTMIVEIREIKKKKKNKTDIEKIINQDEKNKSVNKNNVFEKQKNQTNEKELAKQAKLDEKRRMKKEKELIKQAKLDEKKRMKKEKELIKQAKLDEKKRMKKEKELAKQTKLDEKISEEVVLEEELEKFIIEEDKNITKEITINEINEVNANKFKSMVERILKKNSSKSYPDINNIPN